MLPVIGLCVGLIALPEEFYEVWCVEQCDREASTIRRTWPTRGLQTWGEKRQDGEEYLEVAWRKEQEDNTRLAWIKLERYEELV